MIRPVATAIGAVAVATVVLGGGAAVAGVLTIDDRPGTAQSILALEIEPDVAAAPVAPPAPDAAPAPVAPASPVDVVAPQQPAPVAPAVQPTDDDDVGDDSERDDERDDDDDWDDGVHEDDDHDDGNDDSQGNR